MFYGDSEIENALHIIPWGGGAGTFHMQILTYGTLLNMETQLCCYKKIKNDLFTFVFSSIYLLVFFFFFFFY